MAIALPVNVQNLFNIEHGDSVRLEGVVGIFCIVPRDNYFGGIRMIRRIGGGKSLKMVPCSNISHLRSCRVVLTEKAMELNPINFIYIPQH